MADIDWKRQFDSMGPQGVRSALLGTRWDGEMRAAAREWLERADANAWQATRKAGAEKVAEGDPGNSTMDRFRKYLYNSMSIGGTGV